MQAAVSAMLCAILMVLATAARAQEPTTVAAPSTVEAPPMTTRPAPPRRDDDGSAAPARPAPAATLQIRGRDTDPQADDPRPTPATPATRPEPIDANPAAPRPDQREPGTAAEGDAAATSSRVDSSRVDSSRLEQAPDSQPAVPREPAAPPPPPTEPAPGPAPSRSGSLVNQALPTAPTVDPSPAASLPPLRQILVLAGDIAEAEQQRRQLQGYGLRILARKRQPGLGWVLSTFRVPANVDMAALQRELRGAFPDLSLESNQRYRLMEAQPPAPDPRFHGQHRVGLAVPSPCTQAVSLAMLDSAVSDELVAGSEGRIRRHDVTDSNPLPTRHGTAVANLLVSNDPDTPGLLPKASLLAINVFAEDSQGNPETRTDWILYGLDHLAGQQPLPAVVNLSFGGEPSRLIELALQQLQRRLVLVAAAGNGGDERPVYPAAYDSVVAVGALDARGRRSRQSSHGAHVQLYAPGEDIWTRNPAGRGYYMSGSSFAAPFASAALALWRAEGKPAAAYLQSLNKLDGARQLHFAKLCPTP